MFLKNLTAPPARQILTVKAPTHVAWVVSVTNHTIVKFKLNKLEKHVTIIRNVEHFAAIDGNPIRKHSATKGNIAMVDVKHIRIAKSPKTTKKVSKIAVVILHIAWQ